MAGQIRLEAQYCQILSRPSLSDLEQLDPDESHIFFIENAQSVRAALAEHFTEYYFLNQYKKRRNQPLLAANGSGLFSSTDENGCSVARRMVDFLVEARVSLGDEGTWQMSTLREYILKRDGINLADIAHKKLRAQLPIRKTLLDADYADELASFRFPSTSCLYGVSQPLADLRGAVKFRKLFIRDGSGVYVAFDDDEVLYVGMSQCFSQRLSNTDAHHKLKIVVDKHPNARVAVIHYPFWKLSELTDAITTKEKDAAWVRIRGLLFGLERASIEYYSPRYNGAWMKQNCGDRSLAIQ